jgi:hypothetical protein
VFFVSWPFTCPLPLSVTLFSGMMLMCSFIILLLTSNHQDNCAACLSSPKIPCPIGSDRVEFMLLLCWHVLDFILTLSVISMEDSCRSGSLLAFMTIGLLGLAALSGLRASLRYCD